MTWSIIARDSSTGQFGIAVATRFFAVGARVPHIAAGVGAIATQALVNPYFGIDGLTLLRAGKSPRQTIDLLTAGDSGHAARQVHIMDASGIVAAYTGAECIDYCGHIEGPGFSVAGNMLADARVLEDTADAFTANAGLPFAERLIAAMIWTCASTTTPIRWANSNGSKPSAVNAGSAFVPFCRPARIPRA